jgi:hypothetical protein
MGMKKLVLKFVITLNDSKPVVLAARMAGVPDQVFKAFNQSVFDELELSNASVLEVLWPNRVVNMVIAEPEGLLVARYVCSTMYRRLHRIGLEDKAQRWLTAAQYYGRAYLEATRETRFQDLSH